MSAGGWGKYRAVLLMIPALVLFVAFFLYPIFLVFAFSFFTYLPGGFYTQALTLQNYVRFFTVPIYPKYLFNTITISLESTVLSILLGYPITHLIVRTKTAWVRKVLLALIILTFFMGSIPQVFSWLITFNSFDALLQLLGSQPVAFIGVQWSIVIGLVSFLMPIAIFSLMGSLRNIDPTLEEASSSLGAGDLRTFVRVTLPLSIPGLAAASLLCFTVGLTAFVTPQILGGGIVQMMSNTIYTSFLENVNYPFGAALSVILLVTSLSLAYVVDRLLTRRVRL